MWQHGNTVSKNPLFVVGATSSGRPGSLGNDISDTASLDDTDGIQQVLNDAQDDNDWRDSDLPSEPLSLQYDMSQLPPAEYYEHRRELADRDVVHGIMGWIADEVDESTTDDWSAFVLRDHVEVMSENLRMQSAEVLRRGNVAPYIHALHDVVESTQQIEKTEGATEALRFYIMCLEDWGHAGPDVDYALENRLTPNKYKIWVERRKKTEQALQKLSKVLDDHPWNTTDAAGSGGCIQEGTYLIRSIQLELPSEVADTHDTDQTAEIKAIRELGSELAACAAHAAHSEGLQLGVDASCYYLREYDGRVHIGYEVFRPV